MSFESRDEAGRKLSEKMAEEGLDPDIVLACSISGFEVAKTVAEELGTELDLRLAESIDVPGESNTVVAGVADEGTVWVDRTVKNKFQVSGAFIDHARIVKSRLLGLEKLKYSDNHALLAGKKVLLVDDVVTDSNRIAAALGSVTKQGAVEISFAAPLVSDSCLSHIRSFRTKHWSLTQTARTTSGR
ncbi:MAG: phosphoribosyltransferase family protein [Candidatus Nanohalobium sp.]